MKAIGVLEVASNIAAIVALDEMVKAADVKLVTMEKALGGRLVSIVIEGSISDVKEAMQCGERSAKKNGKVAARAIINSPHEVLQSILARSREKLEK